MRNRSPRNSRKYIEFDSKPDLVTVGELSDTLGNPGEPVVIPLPIIINLGGTDRVATHIAIVKGDDGKFISVFAHVENGVVALITEIGDSEDSGRKLSGNEIIN